MDTQICPILNTVVSTSEVIRVLYRSAQANSRDPVVVSAAPTHGGCDCGRARGARSRASAPRNLNSAVVLHHQRAWNTDQQAHQGEQ